MKTLHNGILKFLTFVNRWSQYVGLLLIVWYLWVIYSFLIFVAQNFGIIWAWQGINDKTRISHDPLRLEKVMKFMQWVCYENCEWHFPTCYIVWIMCCSWIYSPWTWKSLQMICTHGLDFVDFGFLWCPWVFTVWLIHTKNLGDTWENHVRTLLQWRIGPSWCIVVMKNLCLVKVLEVGDYWSWKIIWNSVQIWVSFMFV